MQKHTFILLRTLRIMQKGTIKNNKKAFTLAEVLVSLTLLGILAAILIPTISRSKPNPNKVMFKKEYNVLEKAVNKMINDDTIYPGNITEPYLLPGPTLENIASGFHYMTDPTKRAGSKNKFCYYLAENLNTIGITSCPNNTTYATVTKFATTADGADWYHYTETAAYQFRLSDYFTEKIIIDVNGSDKGPNCTVDSNYATYTQTTPVDYQTNSGTKTKCPNPDTFIFGIRHNGQIHVGQSMGDGSTDITDQTAIDYLSDPLNNK